MCPRLFGSANSYSKRAVKALTYRKSIELLTPSLSCWYVLKKLRRRTKGGEVRRLENFDGLGEEGKTVLSRN